MSTPLSTPSPTELDGWDMVRESLAAIRAEVDESARFFEDLFQRAQSLLDELVREQQQWRLGHGQDDSHVADCLKRCEARLEATIDRLDQELATVCPSPPGSSTQADLAATITGRLAETQAEVTETRAEIQGLAQSIATATQESLPREAWEQLQAEMEELRRERDTMREQRLLLETELENVRRRAVELTETLESQKRATAEQEQYWRAEFSRQHGLVERLTNRLLQSHPPDPAAAAQEPRATTEGAGGQIALESLRAQFELLQEEATRRRKETGEAASRRSP